MTHRFTCRVYYEDTDLAGVVYYANYLKFIERGRSELVRELGIDQLHLQAAQGVVFAVRHLEADYLIPARFQDDLCIETVIKSVTAARITLCQQVKRSETLLFDSTVVLVCLHETGRAARIPAEIRALFDQFVV